jgi:D-aminopeptidase
MTHSRTASGSLITPALILITLFAAPAWSANSASDTAEHHRLRARDLGLHLGQLEPGPLNAITDVPGVKVGHVTLVRGEGALIPGEGPVRTGVTVIVPRDDVWHKKVPAGAFVLNGTGEMTGLAWVAESGFLEYPIALTNTLNVPRVANGVISWMLRQHPGIGITDDTLTPVVAECDDGRLNDIQGRHVSEADVMRALDDAATGPVAEGSVGAGTGMISYGFKGGIGTASRRLAAADGGYTVGVLVNANHGRRPELTMGGVPVGRQYDAAGPRSGHRGEELPSRLHADREGTSGNAEGVDYRRHRHRRPARQSTTDSSREASRTRPRANRLDGTPRERRFHAGVLHRQRHSPLPHGADLFTPASRRHTPEFHDYGHGRGHGGSDSQCANQRDNCHWT